MNDVLSLLPDCTVPNGPMRAFLDALASREGRPERWQPSRLILQNFWVYRYQEYELADGRMVLKGANQTGKTVVLAAAIPVVLDGITRPERFDPDDSRARTLTYFLLGGANEGPPFRYDDRTAYVALEFRHGRTGEYRTIGIGLRASRSVQSIAFWGFVVGDGRRVGRGHEIPLHREDRRPLTAQELAELLGDDARNVVARRSREEYIAAVNQALFGFEELDQYRFLISILLQLRSPKLAQSQQVSSVEEALTRSLPELEESVTRQASRIVSDISSARNMIRKTREELDAATRIDRAYGYLMNQLAQEDAFRVLERHKELGERESAIAKARGRRDEAAARLEAATAAIESAEAERDGVRSGLATLRELDALERHEELLETERAIEQAVGSVSAAKTGLAGAEEAVASADARVAALGARWTEDTATIRTDLEAALAAARDALWANAEQAVSQSLAALGRSRLDNGEDPVRTLGAAALASAGAERALTLETLATRIDAERQAEREYDVAKSAVDRAAVQRARADDALQADRRTLAAAREAVAAAVRTWADDDGRVTVLDEQGLDAVEAALAAVRDADFDVRDVFAAVNDRAADQRAAIETQRRTHEEARARLQSEIGRLQAERDEWLARESAVPAPARGQRDARERLAAAGVVAEPLYAAVDFDDGLDDDTVAAIETAIEDAGLLDALVIAPEDAERAVTVLGEGSDRWIRARSPVPGQPYAGRTLAALLRPASRTLADVAVLAALAAISLDDVSAVTGVGRDGRWALGALHGVSERKPEGAQYIGEANRIREKERQLRRIASEIERFEAERAGIDSELDGLTAAARAIESELKELGSMTELATLRGSLNRVVLSTRAFEDADRAVREAETGAERGLGALRDAQRARRVIADEIPEARGLNVDGVRSVLGVTRALLGQLSAIERRGPTIRRLRDDYAGAVRDAGRERDRLVQARRHLSEMESNVRALEARLDTLRRHLVETGVDVEAVLREIRELEARDAALDKAIRSAIADSATAQADVRHEDEALERLASERGTVAGALASAIESLGLRLDDEPHEQTAAARTRFHSQDEDAGPVAAAGELLRARTTEGDELARRIRSQLQEAATVLNREYSDARALLVEYHPELGVAERNADQRIRFRYEGQPVSPSTLVERLSAVTVEHQRILQAREHELYSEFFLREIAFKLREKIADAERVTRQVNELLRARPIAQNGEVLEIDWKPKPPDPSDSESSDYARLVQLLGHADTSILPDEDTRWIVDFFRRRVDRLTAEDERGELDSVFDVALREALDYRQWYEFRLFTRMPDRPHQRITSEGFGRRSGAGKALVIFLPFLAAAHVQYSAARRDAPKLIGLDEAFERVDAENLDRMFDVLVSWHFSWIMTGHDLWGMASALPACTTYEQKLTHDVVTPILHVWDGTRMHHSLNTDELAAAHAATSTGGLGGLEALDAPDRPDGTSNGDGP